MSAEKCPRCEAPRRTDGAFNGYKCGSLADDAFRPSRLCDEMAAHNSTKHKLASAEAEWKRKESVLVAAAQEIERKLSAAEAKLADAIADAESWQKQADDRLSDALEFGRRAEKAEARVKELEGLAIGNESEGDGGRWFEVFIPTERIGGANCEGEECPTLGDAIPRKDQ